MKKKKVIVIFIVALCIVVMFTFLGRVEAKPPQPNLSVENKIVPVAQGSYCWSKLFDFRCVDMISPPEIVEHFKMEPVVVSANAELKISFKENPKKDSLGATLWLDNLKSENVKVTNSKIKLPSEKGTYIYAIHGYWENGSSSYIFVIEVS